MDKVNTDDNITKDKNNMKDTLNGNSKNYNNNENESNLKQSNDSFNEKDKNSLVHNKKNENSKTNNLNSTMNKNNKENNEINVNSIDNNKTNSSNKNKEIETNDKRNENQSNKNKIEKPVNIKNASESLQNGSSQENDLIEKESHQRKNGKERHSKKRSKRLSKLEKKRLYPNLNIIKDSSIESIANYIQENDIKNIIVMTGAGISTSAGIPDFRTPKSGLYDNLQDYNLPYPEAIFDIEYFRENPKPFLTLAKSLYPGRFRPTLCHYFIRMLAEKGLLLRLYTQNIDTLERVSGIPEELLIEAHGSFHTAHCIGKKEEEEENSPPGCHKAYTKEYVRDQIFNDKIPYCTECGGLIKPDIVFFGEDLPARFFEHLTQDFKKCELLLVIGTSLNVQPFCSIIDLVSSKTPRCLINLMSVGVLHSSSHGFDFTGEYQKYRRDAFFQGTCDDGCLKLAQLLGFEEELQEMVSKSIESVDKSIQEFSEITQNLIKQVKISNSKENLKSDIN